MPGSDADGVDYRQFLQAVRRFKPTALLPALAQASAADDPMQLKRASRRARLPRWVMSAVAAESIVHGTEFQRRSDVRQQDLVRLANLYWQTDRTGPDPSAAEVMTPLVHEQFVTQQSQYEELCRAKALLSDEYDSDAPLDWPGVFGFRLEDGLRCSLLLNAWVVSNKGRFDPDLLERPEVAEAIDRFTSRGLLLAVADQLTATIEQARGAALEGGHSVGLHAAWEFNPLVRYPLIDLGSVGVWAPQTSLVSEVFLPRTLYYIGFREWGTEFPRRLGARLEEYVGRQVRLVAGEQLVGKIVFRRNKADAESVDWIWVHPAVVVLIEVKSARLTAAALAGRDLSTMTARCLSKAREQIDQSAERVRSRDAAFAAIPADRPMIGLAVTGEPIHLANSALPEYGQPSATPSVVISVRDLEMLVTNPGQWVIDHLLRVVLDPELRTHVFSATLPDRQGSVRNPILDQAWSSIAPAAGAAEAVADTSG